MKRKLLILLICSGLLAPCDLYQPGGELGRFNGSFERLSERFRPKWDYGYTSPGVIMGSQSALPKYLASEKSKAQANLHACKILYNEQKKLILCINEFREKLDNAKPDVCWIYLAPSLDMQIEQAKLFGAKLQTILKPHTNDITRRLQNIQMNLGKYQKYIDPVNYDQLKSIYDEFKSVYKYYKIAADLKILFQLYPTMWLNIKFPCLAELNLSTMQEFINKYFGIVGQHDKSEATKYILAIEDVLKEISPTYPEKFGQACMDLESLKARYTESH